MFTLHYRLIAELEQELLTLQSSHQQLAYKLKTSHEYNLPIDITTIENELQNLIERMQSKSQHIEMARTIHNQVNYTNTQEKELPMTNKFQSVSSTRTSTASSNLHEHLSVPVNYAHNKVALPVSNIAALRTMRNIQTTLRAEDLIWD